VCGWVFLGYVFRYDFGYVFGGFVAVERGLFRCLCSCVFCSG